MIYRERLTYCKDCGAELRFVRTAYDHWMPCDAMTGEPHFHDRDGSVKGKGGGKSAGNRSGLSQCRICGRPVFYSRDGTKRVCMDYSTLEPHQCRKADITRLAKYNRRQRQKGKSGDKKL